ncbi:hypothetical protein B9G53_24625 [Pseudanabaena sp. SR411]|uniref:P-loop NTPase fold protein n=1 Tax=Pseudanabaena sp. SR411 TaxID=1980935 RepID=UPI000B97CB12|nr:P-loop NTPase fold protein [Pseudanabaena sp. SR411]OYQ61951.1 hypothetical protein B9G53_24625 [Pseudanabaena sp. SR411]
MNSTVAVKNTLDSFFKEKDFPVLVLKGSWGIGKTYFWESYIKDKIAKKEIQQTAYSYVSLFGLHNLSELKSKIFRVGELLKPETEVIEELINLYKKENAVLRILFDIGTGGQNSLQSSPQIAKITNFFLPLLAPIHKTSKFLSQPLVQFFHISKSLPQSKPFLPIINLVEHGLISNYLICLDDIERKENDLSIRQIMGFIDEISKRKNCKVIIILNDKTLGHQDLEEFGKYREKVIDLEIEYRPSIRDNLLKVFDAEHLFFDDFLNIFQILNVSNIRILKKFKWSAIKIQEIIENTENSLQKQVLLHLAVFCWGAFNSESKLSLPFIIKRIKETTWLSVLLYSEESQDLTEEEKEWRSIASVLGLFPSSYDDYLVSMLTDGYLNEEAFRVEIDKENQKEQLDITQKNLRKAWNIYADSFDDNVEHLKLAIRDILDADLSKITLWDFSQSIDLLEEYGDNVNDYIDKYVNLNSDNLASADPEDFLGNRKIGNTLLAKKIQELQNKPKISNIDDILDGIVEKQGWERKEVEFLSSLTEDNIYEWMMSKPNGIVSKIRKGLFLFREISSNNEEENQKYKTIVDNTTAALVRIAKQNKLNEKRVKFIYKVEIPNDSSQ